MIAYCYFLYTEYAEGAVDQLDLEENTVLQNLSVDLPERYDVMGK